MRLSSTAPISAAVPCGTLQNILLVFFTNHRPVDLINKLALPLLQHTEAARQPSAQFGMWHHN